jgi:uncharacterized cupredoxin-like copper-binding protein
MALSRKERKIVKKYLLFIGSFALLLTALVACGGGGSTSSTGSLPVQVTETDFHITSSVTTFVPGKTYHFAVTNQGKTMHEFMLMPRPEGNMSGMSMDQMDKAALTSIAMINPGETKTLDYTFPSSAAGTHPELACYFPGHYEAGMKLDVAVSAV